MVDAIICFRVLDSKFRKCVTTGKVYICERHCSEKDRKKQWVILNAVLSLYMTKDKDSLKSYLRQSCIDVSWNKIVVLVEFQNVRGESQRLTMMGNCQYFSYISLPCLSLEWLITCPFFVVCGLLDLLLWLYSKVRGECLHLLNRNTITRRSTHTYLP